MNETKIMQCADQKEVSVTCAGFKQVHVSLSAETDDKLGIGADELYREVARQGDAQPEGDLEGWPWKGAGLHSIFGCILGRTKERELEISTPIRSEPQLADCKALDHMLGWSCSGFMVCKVVSGGPALHLYITFDSGDMMRQCTVGQLKDLLETEAGTPHSRQILVQSGVELQNTAIPVAVGPWGFPSGFILLDSQQDEKESISVRAGKDRCYELEVSLTDTVGQLKKALEKESGVPKSSMTLWKPAVPKCTAIWGSPCTVSEFLRSGAPRAQLSNSESTAISDPFMTISSLCELHDEWRLGTLCAHDRSSLTMAQPISVSAMTIAGALCSVKVVSSDTVLWLKTAFMGELGISPCKQILLLDTTVLQDSWLLLELGIDSDTVLTLVKKPEDPTPVRSWYDVRRYDGNGITPSYHGTPCASPRSRCALADPDLNDWPSAFGHSGTSLSTSFQDLCPCHSGTSLSPPFQSLPLWALSPAGSEAWSAPGNTSSSVTTVIASTSVVRVRGLPFTVAASDIITFFAQHDIVEPKEIQLLYCSRGRPNGQAIVRMHDEKDADHAQRALHQQWIGSHCIEVVPHREEA